MAALRSFLLPLVASVALIFAPVAAAAQPPAWFAGEIKALTAESGRWVADNSAYKSENEPFDAYVIEWTAGFDGHTMTGRLYGLKDGVATPAFWEFRQYWHPGRGAAVLDQFGWGGVLGSGTMANGGDGVTVTDQTFFQLDGTTRREGHRSHFRGADTHVTESFDIVGENWTPRRTYVWKLQTRAP